MSENQNGAYRLYNMHSSVNLPSPMWHADPMINQTEIYKIYIFQTEILPLFHYAMLIMLA